MNNKKNELMIEFFALQNLMYDEQNFMEILKGYCENSLENSDELNKIYSMLDIIYNKHLNVMSKAEEYISGF